MEQKKVIKNLGLKIFIAGLLSFLLLIGLTIVWCINIKFQAQGFENILYASNQSSKNVYSSVDKILSNSGITTSNFSETTIKAIQENVKKYADKPDLMMLWIQENPQQIDSKLWENFQKLIEIQHTKFEMEQKHKISVSQEYRDFLYTTMRGQVAQIIWSYPTNETLKIMEQVVQTEDTKEAFDTGIEKPKNYLK